MKFFEISINSPVIFKQNANSEVFKIGKYSHRTTILYENAYIIDCEVIIPFDFF